MKNRLLATTALVVGGALMCAGPASAQMAKPQKVMLHLGGFYEGWVGVAVQNEDNPNVNHVPDVDQQSDSEIYFRGDTTLDNGLKVGAHFELEGDNSRTSGSNAMDESEVHFSGRFGRVVLGADDSAPEEMHYHGENVGTNIYKSDLSKWIQNPGVTGYKISSQVDLGTGDDNKVTYYTPRVSGFQLGVSYLPSANNNTESIGANNETTTSHNGVFAGANFVRSFGMTHVAVSLGYGTMESADNNVHEGNQEGYSIGTEIKFAGWTVGGAYLHEETGAAGARTQTDHWDASVGYEWGMHNVSLGYEGNSSPVTRNGDSGHDEVTQVNLAYARNLGPGIYWRNSVLWGYFDGAVDTSLDNNGWAYISGIDVSF